MSDATPDPDAPAAPSTPARAEAGHAERERLRVRAPWRVQKVTLRAGPPPTLVLEIYAEEKAWLIVHPEGGDLRLDDKRFVFDVEGDAKELHHSATATAQAVLRKELVPSALLVPVVDDTVGTWRLTFDRKDAPPRALMVEQDAADARVVLLGPSKENDGERVLLVLGKNPRPVDGRDLRRGRLYEPPRQAPRRRASSFGGAGADVRAPVVVDAVLQALRARLRDEHRRLQRLQKALAHDLDKHGDPAALAADGERFKRVMHTVARGAAFVDVPADDGEGGESVRVVLDERRDAKGNLERLFQRAKKAKTARALIQPRLEQVQERLRLLDEARARVTGAVPSDDDKRAAAAVFDDERARPSARRAAMKDGPRRAWRSFRCAGDVVVRVGRGAADNDELVRSARGNDLWLHARDHTGAHVVVPAADTFDAALVGDAALLAVHFSAARGERSALVQSTRVKHLKKPGKGAAPGLFHVSNESVVSVRLDEERLARLLAAEVASR